MLSLKNITKDYTTGDTTVHALRQIDITFRANEFVCVLGPSGGGKTTLLNIIGGLDQYTGGDLIISGRSTKAFKDSDWDAYRNHSVGFVFQTYNLISHQSVLANVELALTLSGVSKAERRRRAAEALEAVGLGDQLNKKPNQLSGGQMQRVAIARALVNNPEILLADEPTGALDTDTSLQIMDILKEVAHDRLVVMVTHNPELAEKYATRIVNLVDGRIIGDSMPCGEAENAQEQVESKKKIRLPSMSFFTALSLSLNNLMTKKGRTLLTSFAGSIGIIGIALILALSTGVNNYITDVQQETLSSYPISIYSEETDVSGLISSIMGISQNAGENHEKDAVYASSVMYDLINTMNSKNTKTNNLRLFKNYLDDAENNDLSEYMSNMQYVYDVDLNIYATDPDGKHSKADMASLFENVYGTGSQYDMFSNFSSGLSSNDIWKELMPGEKNADGGYSAYVADAEKDRYELLYGSWPAAANEVMLVLDKNNEVTDITLYALGLISGSEMKDVMMKAVKGEEVGTTEPKSWRYEDITGLTFRLIMNSDYYSDTDGDGVWEDITDNETLMDMIISGGLELKLTGVVRPNSESSGNTQGFIGYTSALTEYIINKTNQSALVIAQTAPENENIDLFTGLPFYLEESDAPSNSQKAEAIRAYLSGLDNAAKKDIYIDIMSTPSEAYVEDALQKYMAQYQSREEIEKLIKEQYSASAGVGTDTIAAYIKDFTDDELKKMLEDAIREKIISGYREDAKKSIITAASAPSDDVLASYTQMLAESVLSQMSKSEFIIMRYTSDTSMPAQTVGAWLSTLSEEERDGIFNQLIRDMAVAQSSGAALSDEALALAIGPKLDQYLATLDEAALAGLYDNYMPSTVSESSLEENLEKLGVRDLSEPSAVYLYAETFEAKDKIADKIGEYNQTVDEADKITYTDYVALIMSSVTTIINAISYILIAFVAVSLVVSSIMIGIITYISVLERTKEIGILRSIGASKKDISRVFNAETFIVGLAAGAIGIGITVLLCYPINWIIRAVTDIQNIGAVLPWQGGLVLILISMVLTVIAGLIPSKLAAKKDPVVALRTE